MSAVFFNFAKRFTHEMTESLDIWWQESQTFYLTAWFLFSVATQSDWKLETFTNCLALSSHYLCECWHSGHPGALQLSKIDFCGWLYSINFISIGILLDRCSSSSPSSLTVFSRSLIYLICLSWTLSSWLVLKHCIQNWMAVQLRPG